MLTSTEINANFNWIQVSEPSLDDLQTLQTTYLVTPEMLGYVVDPDERARLELDPGAKLSLIIFDVYSSQNDQAEAQTVPVSFLITARELITFTNETNQFVNGLIERQLNKQADSIDQCTQMDVVIPILYSLSTAYFKPIRLADRDRRAIQKELRNNINHTAINQFMAIETGLVYMLSSLKGNVSLLNELKRRAKHLTDAQSEVLDDVIVEAQQGLEMATMTSDMTEKVSDAYSRVLDSELNTTMRILTIFSIVLTIPAIVFGFFGENVPLPLMKNPYGWQITIAITLVLCAISIYIMSSNRWWRKSK